MRNSVGQWIVVVSARDLRIYLMRPTAVLKKVYNILNTFPFKNDTRVIEFRRISRRLPTLSTSLQHVVLIEQSKVLVTYRCVPSACLLPQKMSVVHPRASTSIPESSIIQKQQNPRQLSLVSLYTPRTKHTTISNKNIDKSTVLEPILHTRSRRLTLIVHSPFIFMDETRGPTLTLIDFRSMHFVESGHREKASEKYICFHVHRM